MGAFVLFCGHPSKAKKMAGYSYGRWAREPSTSSPSSVIMSSIIQSISCRSTLLSFLVVGIVHRMRGTRMYTHGSPVCALETIRTIVTRLAWRVNIMTAPQIAFDWIDEFALYTDRSELISHRLRKCWMNMIESNRKLVARCRWQIYFSADALTVPQDFF